MSAAATPPSSRRPCRPCLAGAALLRRAGLASVLDALRRYRVACASGAVQVAPKDCFRAGLCKWAQA
eukprot:3039404-Pyramimonas_sp.AAC.1